MSAQVYDPTNDAGANAISMTAAAQAHVRRQLVKEGADALLLGITESGCNGYMYSLSFVAANSVGTRHFDFDGVTVFVEDQNWPLVRGTQIDYVREGLNAALTFKNPNATGECGCGESFSVGESAH